MPCLQVHPTEEHYTSLNGLAYYIHKGNVEKGWWPDDVYARDFGELIALIHSEASEAYEEYRNGNHLDQVYYEKDSPYKPEGVPVELVDVIYRCLDILAAYKVDIDYVMSLKYKYNQSRPYRHGGKKA